MLFELDAKIAFAPLLWAAVLFVCWSLTKLLACNSKALNEAILNSVQHQSNSGLHHKFVAGMAKGEFAETNIFSKDDLLENALFNMGLTVKESYESGRARGETVKVLVSLSEKRSFDFVHL